METTFDYNELFRSSGKRMGRRDPGTPIVFVGMGFTIFWTVPLGGDRYGVATTGVPIAMPRSCAASVGSASLPDG